MRRLWSVARLSTTSTGMPYVACKREGVLAGDRVGAGGLCLLKGVVQELQAVFEVAEELLLLLLDRGLDPADALGQLGIGLLHDLRDDRDELVEERLAAAHLVGVEDGPAQQAADHVALLFRAGPDVFVDAEGQGPDMVRHAADADAVGMVAVVLQSERVGDRRDDRLEDIGFKDRPDTLQAGRRPLEAHAGVDVLLGQRLELAGADAVELGEDQVPDFDFLGPGAVVEDFRAGPAHAVGTVGRCTGRPEIVVLAQPGDPVRGNLDLVVPDVVGLVVVEVDGDRELIGGDLERCASRTPTPSGSPRA